MSFFENALAIPDEFLKETLATLYMTGITAVIAGFFGLVLGLILVLTSHGGLKENPIVYSILDKLVNMFRSIPFIILLAMIAPLTRLIVNTTIGNTAAIVPLVIGTTPFFARQVENALAEVNPGVIEAAKAMGNSDFEIVTGVYLREGLPGLLRAGAMTLISLIGLTAMAGAVGAGGLGKIAITKGYNRFRDDITIVATVIILILVYIIQGVSNYLVKKVSH